MSKSYRDIIAAFSNAAGVSGFEDDVLAQARKFAAPSMEIEEDRIRNLYLRPKGNKGKRPVVMVDGHADEVGFMVQLINRNGTLKFVPMGGWSPQVVMGQKVRVRNVEGEYLPGVIGAKPPHFAGPREKNGLVDIPAMFIDIGASSKAEVEEDYRVAPGAPVVPHVDCTFDEKRGLMMGKAFDCRLGCAAVIETLNALEGASLNVDLVGTLTSQEEVGLRGARVASRTVEPDVAVIFEGTPADDVFQDEISAQSVLRKGPQIRHRDGSMVANPRFVSFAREVAQKANIPFQDAVRESGGTNGGIVHLAGEGVPVVVIGVPVRYIHAPHGIAAMADFEAAVRWGGELIKRLDEEVIGRF